MNVERHQIHIEFHDLHLESLNLMTKSINKFLSFDNIFWYFKIILSQIIIERFMLRFMLTAIYNFILVKTKQNE